MFQQDGKLEGIGEALEAALDGTVKNVVTHADAKASQKIGSDLILGGQIRAVLGSETGNNALAGGCVDFHGALDSHLAAVEFQTGQTMKGRKNSDVIPWLGFDQAGDLAELFARPLRRRDVLRV